MTMIWRTGQTTEDNRVHALLYFISPTGHGLRLIQAGVDAGKYMVYTFKFRVVVLNLV